MDKKPGAFVISLDFEMMWGILDNDEPMEYEENIKNVKKVVPKILDLFKHYNIHATWAVVGMLMEDSVELCEKNKPNLLPTYEDDKFSSYNYFEFLKGIDSDYLFAKDLVEKIKKVEGQEIATHTYSHYYCLERGQTEKQFDADIKQAKNKAREMEIDFKTIIFPRNQFNREYLDTLTNNGIECYRGNEKAWFYQSTDKKKSKSLIRRGLRLLDNYIPLAGSCCYDYTELKDEFGLKNIPCSRFLRPYSRRLSLFEPIRLSRIKGQMRYAAKHGKVFHLWWHPHNFGKDVKKNLQNLRLVLDYYNVLKKKYDYISLNIGEV